MFLFFGYKIGPLKKKKKTLITLLSNTHLKKNYSYCLSLKFIFFICLKYIYIYIHAHISCLSFSFFFEKINK